MKTSAKFALAAACISIFGFGRQMQSVYAIPRTPLAVMPQQHSPNKTSVLKVGSKGPAVTQAQNILRQEGFYKGPINGVFSPQMESAVKAFQKSEHISATGVIGAETRAVMK